MPRPSEICKDPDVKRRYPPTIEPAACHGRPQRIGERRNGCFRRLTSSGHFFFLTNTPILIKIETGCKYFTLCKSFDAKKIRGHFISFCNICFLLTGMKFLYLYVKKQLKNCLKEHFSTIILLSINHRHTDSQMLHFLCVCVCAFLFSSLLNIFHIFFIVYRVHTFLFFSLLT